MQIFTTHKVSISFCISRIVELTMTIALATSFCMGLYDLHLVTFIEWLNSGEKTLADGTVNPDLILDFVYWLLAFASQASTRIYIQVRVLGQLSEIFYYTFEIPIQLVDYFHEFKI